MTLLKTANSLLIVVLALLLSTCAAGKLNVFSIEQDKELGRQVSEEIASNPAEYPILSESSNREVYSYVKGIVQKLLSSGKIKYRNEFAWEVKIINDDETLNAFVTPGGYIYLYTGLMKFLDSEDELAGVLGHEMAHADQRHSTQRMTQSYGIATLISVVTGKAESGVIEQVAAGLLQLKFGRNHETEADSYSVVYLCGTNYNAAGAAGFFIKMEDQPRPPEFLSTHPNPGNRVENIKGKAKEQGCRGSQTNRSEYERIKRLL